MFLNAVRLVAPFTMLLEELPRKTSTEDIRTMKQSNMLKLSFKYYLKPRPSSLIIISKKKMLKKAMLKSSLTYLDFLLTESLSRAKINEFKTIQIGINTVKNFELISLKETLKTKDCLALEFICSY